MKLQRFFARHPVFTREEFGRFLDGTRPRGPRATEALLAYHIRAGHLLRLRRGLYAVVPPGMDPASSPIDPYLAAGKMAEDAVLAYHTALEFHGQAYSVHERFLYLTSHASRPLAFRYWQFRGVPFPKGLRDQGEARFGVETAERAGIALRVTSLERTLVDALDRPDLSGGWEELWRSLEGVAFFDLDQVVRYAQLLGNATTAAKVGFFLDQHRERLMVDDGQLRPLHDCLSRSPHYLERGSREPARLVADWNLIVPEALLERSWEEVR